MLYTNDDKALRMETVELKVVKIEAIEMEAMVIKVVEVEVVKCGRKWWEQRVMRFEYCS